MKKIEEYIEESKLKQNVSDGGSPAFSFPEDNVILVCYNQSNKYGIARDCEEEVQKIVNQKRQKGVNCPYHYAIKRTKDEKVNYCWVLQELAPGKSLTNYTHRKNNISAEQLKAQRVIMNQPNEIYDKCILDLCEIFNMGIELKDKNIFYDEKLGFSFIDFLNSSSNSLNYNNPEDILSLCSHLNIIYGSLRILSFYDNATTEDVEMSNIQYATTLAKNFQALRRVIPNFAKYERLILRSYAPSILQVFSKMGIDVSDLTLTSEELKEYNQRINIIVQNCLENLKKGKEKYDNIIINTIRISLENNGLLTDYVYIANKEINPHDYEDEYDFKMAYTKYLEEKVIGIFNERLSNEDSKNEYISEAINRMHQRQKN